MLVNSTQIIIYSVLSDPRRQLIKHESGPEIIPDRDRYGTCTIMVSAGIIVNGVTPLHVLAAAIMTGQQLINDVLLRMFTFSVVLSVISFI